MKKMSTRDKWKSKRFGEPAADAYALQNYETSSLGPLRIDDLTN